MKGRTSGNPSNQLNSRMDSNAESHIFTQGSIALNKSIHGPHCTVNVLEVLSLIEVTDHLPNVICPVAELGKFPVDNEEPSLLV